MPFRHWATFVAIACAAAAVLALPFPSAAWMERLAPTRESLETERARLRGAGQALDAAVNDIRVGEATVRAAAATRRGAGLTTIDPSVPAALRPWVDSLVRDAWRAAGVGASARHAALVIHFDSASLMTTRPVPESRRAADLVFVLPSSETDGRCVAVVRLRRPERHALPRAGELLGPCGFYAAFGMPGAGVEAWLRASGFAFARRSDWGAPPAIAVPTDERLQYRLPAPAAKCAARTDPSCASALALAGETPASGTASAAHEVVARPDGDAIGPAASGEGSTGWWLGEGEGRFLSEAVREFGEARFRAFWTSTEESAPLAFVRGVGVPLEVWTRTWLERTAGPRVASAAPKTRDVIWLLLTLPLLSLAAVRPREHVMWGARPGR